MQTIMIIEDDGAIREELALLLENEGYRPLPVTDFDSVPAQAAQTRPDLILLDIGLPGRDGFALCAEMRKRICVPVIFVTILTIQQLSESNHYQRQFALLRKLGMNRREMARALRTQFAIYYALPALPPLLIGIPFIFNLAGLPEPGVMVGMSSPAAITVISLGIFAAIYAVYILLAYTSLKRDVLPA